MGGIVIIISNVSYYIKRLKYFLSNFGHQVFFFIVIARPQNSILK